MASFSYFLHMLLEHRRGLAFALVLMSLESLVALGIPWFVGQFSIALLQDRLPMNLSLLEISAIWIALFILQAVLRFLSADRMNSIGVAILTRLGCRLYDHIQMLPMGYFDDTKKGEILSLLTNDIAIVSYFLSGVMASLVPAMLLISGSALLMLSIHVQTSLVILVSVPIFCVLLKLTGRAISPLSKRIVQKQADAIALASENFGAIKLVKAFNREPAESARFRTAAHEIQELRRKQQRLLALLSPLMQLLVSSCVLIVVLVGAHHYQTGDLTIPDMIALLMYGLVFARSTSSLAHVYGQIQQVRGASSRLFAALSLEPEPTGRGEVNIPVAGNIVFEDVSFAYASGSVVLQQVSIAVAAGEKVVLLGSNGGGKTTLLHLIMRFMTPCSGNIFVDGRDVRDIDLQCLRSQIGLVSQDVVLYDGNIIDNIAYGHPQASAEEIEEAAMLAGVVAMAAMLEDGLHTPVGEGGVRLSGGQRQRIALARALLTKPAILLLDEPTSMFDQEGRENFQAAFLRICQHRTVLIATHDLALASLGDRVVRL